LIEIRPNNSIFPNNLPSFGLELLKLGFVLQNYLAEKK